MIQIVMNCTKNGELVFCEAKGHSLFSVKGSDIVCSAVTSLLRTSLYVLESNDSVTVKASATERGMLSFGVEKKSEDEKASYLLMHSKDFLEKGLTLICEQYPENVSLKINFDEKWV